MLSFEEFLQEAKKELPTKEFLVKLLEDARNSAYKAADDYVKTKLDGERKAGGLGMVSIDIVSYEGKKLTRRTSIGKHLFSLGGTLQISLADGGTGFSVRHPLTFEARSIQNADAKNKGAEVFVSILKKAGFDCVVNKWSD